MTRSGPQVPVVHLDPNGTDHHGEAARLREAGPVVRVVLPGDVPAWAVTHHRHLDELLSDPRVSKNWRNWHAVQSGEISDDWPLVGMLKVTNMVTADNTEHRRLRRLVTRTFTRGRVESMTPQIEQIVAGLLDDLPGHADADADADGTVDLRQHFAYRVPMQVICDLVGVPEDWQPKLRQLVDSIFRTDTTPQEALDTERERVELLHRLVEMRRVQPTGDLTSALLEARAADPEALSEEELVDTMWLLLTAGHETTLSLIVNAVRALLTHPEQRAMAQAGDDTTWANVIEEALRWDAPIGNFMARYPTEDIEIDGVTIPKGDAILAPYSAVGRDPAQHGGDAHVFDLTRWSSNGAPPKHLAFGGGPHVCLGAHLARLEGTVAVRALFARYPDLSLGVPAGTLPPVPSLFSNSARTLPVLLTGS